MMRIKLSIALVFLVVSTVSSQDNYANKIFNLEAIASLTFASEQQKIQLAEALNKREQSLENASDEEKLAVNKSYYSTFKSIFDEDQKNKVYHAQVNPTYIAEKTSTKYNELVTSYSFPTEHKKVLKSEIEKFEYSKVFYKRKYFLDDEARLAKWDELSLTFNEWRNKQKNAIRQSSKFWQDKVVPYGGFEKRDQDDFIAYHFYINLQENSEAYKERIMVLASSSSLKKAANALASLEAQRVVKSSGALAKLDSTSRNYAGKKLAEHLMQMLEGQLKKYQPLFLEKNTSFYKSIAVEFGKNRQAGMIKKAQKEEMFSRSKKGGLDNETTEKLWSLIQQREEDLELLKESGKQNSGTAGLFENSSQKTKSQIKKAFAKSLAELISRKEFGVIFQSDFKQVIEEKTTEQMTALKEAHKLTEGQTAEIGKMVSTYYFNQAITEAYYSFDKPLKKQKLSVVRYHFEKKFKSLMDMYGFTVNPSSSTNNRTFEW